MPLSTNTAELEKPGLDWCSSLLIGKAEMLIELVVCYRSSEGYQTAGNHQYFPGKCCEVPWDAAETTCFVMCGISARERRAGWVMEERKGRAMVSGEAMCWKMLWGKIAIFCFIFLHVKHHGDTRMK